MKNEIMHRSTRQHRQVHRPMGNKEIVRRIQCVKEAMQYLNDMGLNVLEVDINRPMPVILIQNSTRNKDIGMAFAYSYCNSAYGRVCRMQAQKFGCRIEWEIKGH